MAAGEGILGQQRGFQAAGAGTLVTSLWSIPDKATQALMERFYDNIWRKKMPKLEALREAQLWMVHEGPKDAGLVRGLKLEKRDVAKPDATLPPLYWAAFVLSGDWR